MKCTNCGCECKENSYPEIVFSDGKTIVCEKCSIDYEETENGIQLRRTDQ